MKITGRLVLFVFGVVVVAVIHFFLSFVTAFSAGIGGGPVYVWTSRILTFPLWLIPGNGSSENSSLLGWLPLVFISVLWGCMICYGLHLLSTSTR